jgi:hypothetical protein
MSDPRTDPGREQEQEQELAGVLARAHTAIRRLICADVPGPDSDQQYCWWCHRDINGKDGAAEPHAVDCQRTQAEKARRDLAAWLELIDDVEGLDVEAITKAAALRSSLDAALLEQQRLRDENAALFRIQRENAVAAGEWASRAVNAESTLAILSSSLEGIAGEMEMATTMMRYQIDCNRLRGWATKLRTLLSSITQQTEKTDKGQP